MVVTVGAINLAPGQRIGSRSAGGGGYGDPSQRAQTKIAEDVEDGVISANAARDWALP